MGRLIQSEFQKVLGRNGFYFILISLLAFNLFALWAAERPSGEHPPLQAYRMLQKELTALPNAERPDFVRQYYRNVQSVRQVERIKGLEAGWNEQGNRLTEQLKNQNPAEYAQALSLWENQEALLYTANIKQEAAFAEQIYTEVTALADYPEFLSQIQQRSDTLAGMSIFSPQVGGGFSSRSIQKTAADYAGLTDIVITYDLSYGVEAAASAITTDCLVFVFLFFFAFLTIYDEKNKGLFPLVKSTPLGQIPTMGAKIIVLAVCSMSVVLLLYGSNLLFYHRTAGLGDLSRSLQSIGKYMGSTLRFSAGEFLISFAAIKALVCFLIGLLVMFISIQTRRSTTAFLICAGMLAVSFALYAGIPLNSQAAILKYLNFFGLFRAQDLLGLYLNLNFWGWPVSLFDAGLSAVLLMVCVLSVFNGCVFAKSGDTDLLSWDLPKPDRLCRQRNRSVKSVTRHELFKLLWMNKAIVVLAAAVLIFCRRLDSQVYLTPDEMVYRSYMMQLSGPLAEEQAALIQTESQRFEKLQNQWDLLQEQAAAGEISETQAEDERRALTRGLSKKPAFDRVLEYQARVRQNDGWLVYDTGYLTLLKKDYSGEMLMIYLLLIACEYSIFPTDYVNDMHKLIRTTPFGRGHLRKIKQRIAMGLTLFILLCGILPEIIITAKGYGLPHWDAPLNSLSVYAQFPAFLSIGEFLAAMAALKLLACGVATSLVLTLSQKIRHRIDTLLICILVVVLPLLLTKLGIAWCGYLSGVPLFNAGALLAEHKIKEVAAYTVAAIILLAAGRLKENRIWENKKHKR